MKLRTRLDRLERIARDIPPPDQLTLVVCLKAAGDPEQRPDGVYFNASGDVAEYVFSGAEPDPAVLAPLRERLSRWGALIVSHHPDDAAGGVVEKPETRGGV